MKEIFDSGSLVGPVLVTVFYFLLWYYLLLILQRGTKYRLKEEYESQGKVFDRYFGKNEDMLSADRAVINTQEQMVPFLVALWLHAISVSSVYATWIGTVYVVLRAFYPSLLGKSVSGIQPKRVFWVALPCYLIVFYLFGSTIWAVLT